MKPDIASELRSLRKGIDKLRAELKAQALAQASAPFAVKRIVAAKMMGVGSTKLDLLIAAGKVRTTEDPRLVPVAEVKRYSAPKLKRERKPAVGHRARQRNVDGQSDEAWEQGTKAIRTKAGGA